MAGCGSPPDRRAPKCSACNSGRGPGTEESLRCHSGATRRVEPGTQEHWRSEDRARLAGFVFLGPGPGFQPSRNDDAFWLAQAFLQQVEGGDRERAHVVDTVVLGGFDGDRTLDVRPDHSDAGVPGGMTVTAAGRAGGAGFA